MRKILFIEYICVLPELQQAITVKRPGLAVAFTKTLTELANDVAWLLLLEEWILKLNEINSKNLSIVLISMILVEKISEL